MFYKRQAYRLLNVVIILGMLLSPLESLAAPASQAQRSASQGSPITLHAAGRGNPWINLLDGQDLPAVYTGPDAVIRALESGHAQPVSLATADFDEDGVPDLVGGYSFPPGRGDRGGSGILTLHRGNVDAIYPNSPDAQKRKAEGTFTDAPFLSPARVFEVPVAPAFLGAGDFDADGHWDVVAAAREGETLYLVPGDGQGGFGPARATRLPGKVTALVVGEVNRRDGLADVVVGVDGEKGSQVLVFEGPDGALQSEPEMFAAPAEVTALALGQLDDHCAMDLAVAAGRELLIVHGRDRRLSLDETRQAGVPRATISQRSFSFSILSIAIGDFTGDHRNDLALLSEDGEIYLLHPPEKESPLGESSKGFLAHAADAPREPRRERDFEDGLEEAEEAQETREAVRDRTQAAHLNRHLVGRDGISPHARQDIPDSSMNSAIQNETLETRELPSEGSAPEQRSTLVEPDQRGIDVWQLRAVDVSVGPPDAAGGEFNSRLIRVRVSSRPADDLVVIDGVTRQLHIVEGARLAPTVEPGDGQDVVSDGVVALDARGEPVAALPMRLNMDALDDLVVLVGGQRQPAVVLTAPMVIFTVNLTGDADDANIGDGACDTDLGTPGDQCTLRAAIQEANFNAGADVIQFSIGGGGAQVITPTLALPEITDPLTVDGTSQPGFSGTPIIELDGSLIGPAGDDGLWITAGTTTIRGLVVNGFFEGIRLDTNGYNVIEGNHIINSTGHSDEFAYGGVHVHRTHNTVGGTTTAARNVISGNSDKGIVLGGGATDNLVQGNFIGTDIGGTTALGNGEDGVLLSNWVGGDPSTAASNNTIGGTTAGARNIISGNDDDGVVICCQAAGNLVQGNYIGTDVTGTADLGNADDGVGIYDASNNLIGGTTAGARNVISGNDDNGVVISRSGAVSNTVQGNYIGTDVTGMADLGNADDGVQIGSNASSNLIGGTTAETRNVISGNDDDGVIIWSDAMSNTVQGNYIGTDVTGMADLGNADDGVQISSNASSNLIGGSTAGARNVISGNGDDGVVIRSGAVSNTVQGNYIGTDVAGRTEIPNHDDGVVIGGGANHNIIGGDAPEQRNVISGNADNGVLITGEGTDDNTVSGNYIGTDTSGTVALGNGFNGVTIADGARNNRIGGMTSGERNIISGNLHHGVGIYGSPNVATNNSVIGNYVGIDVTGAVALGNQKNGVRIGYGAQNNVIGGDTPEARNIISGNGENGVLISGEGSDNNTVSGNFIGIDATGNGPLGNTFAGVYIADGASDNVIGGSTLSEGNIIAHNDLYGIYVHGTSTLSNTISHNSIHSNADRGIELTEGGNAELAAPVITDFDVNAGTVTGTTCPGCTVEIFSDTNDEGEVYEGQTTADSAGDFTFNKGAPLTGPRLTATATDSVGNTSEFSVSLSVVCPDFAEPWGVVNAGDVQFVAARWRQEAAGQPYDMYGDGVITIVDIMRVAAAWERTCQ